MKKYSSLGGLERSAMVAGMPLMSIVVVTIFTIIITGIGMIVFGSKAIFLVMMLIPFLLFLRRISANDDQGSRMFFLEICIIIERIYTNHLSKTFCLTSNQSKGDRNRYEYQRSITKKNTYCG